MVESIHMTNADEIEHWLSELPLSITRIFDARNALRVFPLLRYSRCWPHKEEDKFSSIILPYLFAASYNLVSGLRPEFATKTQDKFLAKVMEYAQRNDENNYVISHAVGAIYFSNISESGSYVIELAGIAESVTSVDGLAFRAARSRAPYNASKFKAVPDEERAQFEVVSKALWSSYNWDRHEIEVLKNHPDALSWQEITSQYAARPIWAKINGGMPPKLRELWIAFSNEMKRNGEDWNVWIRWYNYRVDGLSIDDTIDLEFAKLKSLETNWDKGAKLANAELKRITGDRDAVGSHFFETSGDEVEVQIETVERHDQSVVRTGKMVDTLNETSSAPDYIFVSYAGDDRERVRPFVKFFRDQNIPIFWDQDIAPSEGWRDRIGERLETAAGVITFWTELSADSAAVREEAAFAQAHKKFLPVRLEDVHLPFGYYETQYQNLFDWNGSAHDPAMQKILTALRNLLSTL